jgi:hypothetical protein
MQPSTNASATAAMICGITGIVVSLFLGLLALPLGVLGIVFGSVGKSSARRVGRGAVAASTGVVCGIVACALPVVAPIAINAFVEYLEYSDTHHING